MLNKCDQNGERGNRLDVYRGIGRTWLGDAIGKGATGWSVGCHCVGDLTRREQYREVEGVLAGVALWRGESRRTQWRNTRQRWYSALNANDMQGYDNYPANLRNRPEGADDNERPGK